MDCRGDVYVAQVGASMATLGEVGYVKYDVTRIGKFTRV